MANVLAVGAHPDDIELGCGASLAKHVARGDSVVMVVVTDGENGPGNAANRRLETERAATVLGVEALMIVGLPDGEVGNHELELVHALEAAIVLHSIDTLYTHWHLDTHQDHRAIGMASWGAARHVPRVFCYEAPSTRDFDPTVFVDVTGFVPAKVAALGQHTSQVASSRMIGEGRVEALAVVRGFTARVQHAEGFMPHRIVMT